MTSKYIIKQQLINVKLKLKKYSIIVGDINVTLSITEKSDENLKWIIFELQD